MTDKESPRFKNESSPAREMSQLTFQVPGARIKSTVNGEDAEEYGHNLLDSEVARNLASAVDSRPFFKTLLEHINSGHKKVYFEVGTGVVTLVVMGAAIHTARKKHWFNTEHFLDVLDKAGCRTLEAFTDRKVKFEHQEDLEVKSFAGRFKPRGKSNMH